MKNKSLAIKARNIILILIGFIFVFLLGVNLYFKLPVKEFLKASEKSFKIPYIDKNFVPQGLFYDEISGDYYVTGYMKDGAASPIFIIDGKTKKICANVKMANMDGSLYAGHCGGIALYNGKVYVANEDTNTHSLLVFDPSMIRQADKSEAVSYIDNIDLTYNDDYMSVCFLSVRNDKLIVGEFYKDIIYPTCKSHKIKTSNGEYNALAVAFDIVNNKAVPAYAYSIKDNIQGICFKDNNIYLSESYGAAFSHIYNYKTDGFESDFKLNILGKNIPVCILDEKYLINDTKIIPMSEEIDIVNNKMIIINEAASDKYIFGKLLGMKKIYMTDLDLFN